MGDWPVGIMGYGAFARGATGRASVQSGNNTKGSWQEVIAATPFAGFPSIRIDVADISDFLFDIGIGGAGSEIALVNDILLSCVTSAQVQIPTVQMAVPIVLPAGTRLSFRSASVGGGDWANCQIHIVPAAFMPGLAHEVTYGAASADSGGTSIDPGGTADTKGAWVQLVSSTGYPFRGIAIGFGSQQNTARTSYLWYVDVGLTAAPADAIIISDYYISARSEADIITPVISPIYPISIPAGSEIHVRASCSGNDATDRLFDAVLYCFG